MADHNLNVALRLRVNQDGSVAILGQAADQLNRVAQSANNASTANTRLAGATTQGNEAIRQSTALINTLNNLSGQARFESRLAQLAREQSALGQSSQAIRQRIDLERQLAQVLALNPGFPEARARQYLQTIQQAQAETSRLSGVTASAANSMNTAFSQVKNTLVGMFALYQFKQLATDILQVNMNMEMLRAQLKSVTGSDLGSAQAFSFIKQFATDTPFEIEGITKAFIMLQNYGIKPTAEVMSAITNQASKFGATEENLTGIARALGQAWGKNKLQMEEINQLLERGVPVWDLLSAATGKTTEQLMKMSASGEITRDIMTKMIQKMDEMANGGNANAMDTLKGKISNLSDAWHNFEDTLLQDKSEGLIKSIVTSVSESLNILARNMGSSIDDQIAQAKARIKTFNESSVLQFTSSFTGFDINVELNKLDALQKQKAKQSAEAAKLEAAKPKPVAGQVTDEIDKELIQTRIEKLKVDGKIREAYELEAKAIRGLIGAKAEEYVKNKLYIDQKKEHVKVSDQLAKKLQEIQNGRYKDQIVSESINQGVDPKLALTVVQIETNSGNNIKNSSKGAMGLFQMMKGAAIDVAKTTGLSVNQILTNSISSQSSNIKGGIAYIKQLQKQLGENASVENILAAYNGGVNRLKKKNFDISLMPSEAIDYAKKGKELYDAQNKINGKSNNIVDDYAKATEAANNRIKLVKEETAQLAMSNVQRQRANELESALKGVQSDKVDEIAKLYLEKWKLEDQDAVNNLKDNAIFEDRLASLAKELKAQGQTNDAVAKRIDLERQVRQVMQNNPNLPEPLVRQNLQQSSVAQLSLSETLGAPDARKQLEEFNKTLDKTDSKLSAMCDVSSAVFDGALGGISGMMGAFDNMTKSINESTKAMEALKKKQEENAALPDNNGANTQFKLENAQKYAAEEKKLQQEQLSRELTGARQIAGAAAKMFGEKSTAAKAFHNVEIAISVAQMAMEARQLAASVATIIPKLAVGASTMFAQSGWGGFAGVAAMAAVMAAMGYSAASSSGGEKIPETPDSGTVLGDPSAKSDSINNVVTTLKDIHASEYLQLKGINQGVMDLKNSITDGVTKLFQSGGLKTPSGLNLGTQLSSTASMAKSISDGIEKYMLVGALLVKKLPVIGNMLSGIESFILGGLFGKTTAKVSSAGFYAGGKQNVASLMNGKTLASEQFTEITATTKSWFSKSVKVSEMLSPLSNDFRSSLSKMFVAMGSSVLSMATTFGTDLSNSVNNYVIPKIKVSLFGLTSEQMVKKLNNVLSTQLDKMSEKVFGGLIAKYQQLGEGMFQTAERLAEEKAVATSAITATGGTISGDVIAISDGLVQLAGGIKEFQAAFTDYYTKFYTESEQYVNNSKNLIAALGSIGQRLPESRQGFRDLVNAQDLSTKSGRELYTQLVGLSQAADAYYTANEKLKSSAEDSLRSLAGLAPTVASSIYNLNQQLIIARNNWKNAGYDLGTMTDLTTASFAKLKTNLLQPFIDAKSSIQDQIANLGGAQVDPGNIADMMTELSKMTDPTQQINQVNKIQKAIKTRYDNEISLINKTTSALKGIADFLSSLKLSDLSTLSPEKQLRESQGQYGTALLKAQAGNQEALQNLPSLAKTYLEKAQQYYASSEQYAAIFDNVNQSLSDLAGSTQGNTEAVQEATDAATASMTDSLTSLGALLDKFVTDLGAQFDQVLTKTETPPPTDTATNGLQANGGTAQYNTLLEDRNAHLTAYNVASANSTLKGQSKAYIKEQKATAANEAKLLNTSSLKLDNYNYWHNLGDEAKAMQSAADVDAYLQIKTYIANTKLKKADKKAWTAKQNAYFDENGGTLHFRAKGGVSTGSTVIHEDGPELIKFQKPTMVVNNQKTNNLIAMGNEESVQAIKQMNKNLEVLIKLTQASGQIQVDKLSSVADDIGQIKSKIRMAAA